MMIKSSEEIIIYESPDGGKSIYSRKLGEPHNSRTLHSIDPAYKKEQELKLRWVNLKEIVYMADSDPTLNDALTKLEILYALKKEN
jgi:hypothetical protein